MDKLMEILSGSWPFKSISVRQKTLSFLVIFYLWIPMRNRILYDQFRRWSYRNLRLNSIGALERLQSKSRLLSSEEQDGDDDDEVCIPKLPKLVVIYYYLSTITHLINCLTTSMIKFRSVAKDRVADDLFICYMPRAHLHEYISQSYAIWYSLLYSLTLLALRSIALLHWNNIRLNAIVFLLMDAAAAAAATANSNSSSSSSGGGNRRLKRNPYNRSSSSNLLFCCIDSGYKNRAELKLRPNRTQSAREQLVKIVESGFVSAIISCLATACILFPIVFSAVLSKHEPIYEGCRISYGDPVYWYRSIGSIYLFVVLFIDVYLMMPLAAGVGNVLIADLLIYWQYIEEQLSRVKRLLEGEQRGGKNQAAAAASPPSSKVVWSERGEYCHNIERNLVELRTLMGDFFSELRQVDKVISWATFVLFFNWLLSNAIATFTGLQLDRATSSHANIVRLFHLVGIAQVYLISHLVLNLKRRTRPSYGTICSLMALDQGARKRDWMRLIDFYTDRRLCYAFTFFGSGVFDELMFLKLVSYTFTLFSYVETFRLN